VAFDTLRDQRLPPLDGVFIGGGFPETHLDALAANRGLRAELRAAIDAGLPAYAECGGLMYLARSIEWNGHRAEMVGALPADIVMHARPVGRGYVHLRETGHGRGRAAARCSDADSGARVSLFERREPRARNPFRLCG